SWLPLLGSLRYLEELDLSENPEIGQDNPSLFDFLCCLSCLQTLNLKNTSVLKQLPYNNNYPQGSTSLGYILELFLTTNQKIFVFYW
ncbi:MAG: hypothetical protein K2X39_02020, partial [Silvanigrellaceae bacterium]|nr:hypothetical protein [Silvanigrellaceae bacterium]